MNAIDLINRTLAMPHTHAVVTKYECGKERRFTTRNIGSAENYAVGERRKIGRNLIDRDTKKTVRVVAVVIEEV